MQLQPDVLGDHLVQHQQPSEMIWLADQRTGVASEILADQDQRVAGHRIEIVFDVKRALEAALEDGGAGWDPRRTRRVRSG